MKAFTISLLSLVILANPVEVVDDSFNVGNEKSRGGGRFHGFTGAKTNLADLGQNETKAQKSLQPVWSLLEVRLFHPE